MSGKKVSSCISINSLYVSQNRGESSFPIHLYRNIELRDNANALLNVRSTRLLTRVESPNIEENVILKSCDGL